MAFVLDLLSPVFGKETSEPAPFGAQMNKSHSTSRTGIEDQDIAIPIHGLGERVVQPKVLTFEVGTELVPAEMDAVFSGVST